MKITHTSLPLYFLGLLGVFIFCSFTISQGAPATVAGPSGTLVFPHAGDIFKYNLAERTIDLVAERKGRQGPFFSPDGAWFTTNNWPGSNEGVAVWSMASATIQKEFYLKSTLISDDRGVKVAPGGKLFSGIINTPAGENPDFVVTDERGAIKWRMDGEGIRTKGHAWDANQHLYLTGEVLRGKTKGTKFLIKIPDWRNPQIEVIRTFSCTYLDLPDELAISPNGGRIAYAFKKDIWVGSIAQKATDHTARFKALKTLGRPVFSPDGDYLAFAMLNSYYSKRGDIHVAKIPEEGAITLREDGPSLLPGPNSSLKSTWTSGADSSMGWLE